ncbi:unnamed protein product [Candidula unifasciata]|uniref:Dolichyldiphosphatase n=1 Tax=Candidula unifasciata TaxID=100452 RepID=A0A8S3YZH8_9EUPU|nr:unnamed protein product [Candidula unifasciata]
MAEEAVADESDLFNPLDWKPVSFTHVEFPKGDFVGFILAWVSLSPFILIISFMTLIVFRRDLHTMAFLVGLGLDEILNLLIKHAIREPRPLRGRHNLYTEYGMPSSHAQFMWFFSSYFTLFLLVRLYRNQSLIDDLWKCVSAALSVFMALLVSWSRVYLRYHSISQVLCGGFLGCLLGVLWFGTVHFVLTPFFPIISNSPVGEILMVRDSTLIPHVMWFEYTCSRSEARSRQRKMSSRKSQ